MRQTKISRFGKPKLPISASSVRKLAIILAVAAISIAGMSLGEAQTFTEGYSASSGMLPGASSSPTWATAHTATLTGSGSSALLNMGAQYTMNTPQNGGVSAWDTTQLASTLQFDMSVTNPGTFTGAAKFSNVLYISTPAFGMYLGIGSSTTGLDTLTLAETNFAQSATVVSGGSTVFDLSQLTTYRLTLSQTGTGTGAVTLLDLYLNNDTSPVLTDTINGTLASTQTPSDPLQIAYNTGYMSSTATSSWSYVEWTNAGAFAPTAVPEPSTMAFMFFGMGALLWVVRRRSNV